MNDALAILKQDLLRIALRRREWHGQSATAALEALKAFRVEMLALQQKTSESMQRAIETAGPQGKIYKVVGHGVPVDPGAIVYSNMKSRQERVVKIRLVVEAVDEAISDMEAGAAIPADFKKHLEDVRADIPDRNEMEPISAPKD